MKSANVNQIVFVSWKDIKNPFAGGAEVVHQEISKRFVDEGYEVIHLVPGFKGCQAYEVVDGVKIIRVGSSVFSFFSLALYYKKHLRQTTDILVDVFNCFGSFAFIFGAKKQTVFLIHHIQGKVWVYQTVFPFIPPLNYLGWLIEKVNLMLAGLMFKGTVVTVSDSTKHELTSYFKSDIISVISEGSDISHVSDLDEHEKDDMFTILFLGRMVKMKKPLDTLKAFAMFAKKHPNTQLWMAGGDGGDGTMDKIRGFITANGLEDKVVLFNRISNPHKLQLMRKAHVVSVTSVKEGWGLIVTEANSQGTPAITYDVAGLRDSNKKGLKTDTNKPKNLANLMEIAYEDKELYDKLRRESHEHSKQFTFDQSYKDLSSVLGLNDVLFAKTKKPVYTSDKFKF
jgi:glycosyltransferase involved in cell wall biosynthesis